MDDAIELYGAKTGNCLRAAIALEEAGLPYVVRRLDLSRNQHREPSFLKLNPRGKVPTLVTSGAGDSFVLTQSNAIMLYAAELAPGSLLPAQPGVARARALERFLYFVTDVIGPSHAAFALKSLQGGTDCFALLNDRSVEALSAAERFLAEWPFIAGDQFTLADISAYTIAMASEATLNWTRMPNMTQWYHRIGLRPAVNRGLHAFDHEPMPRSL